MYGDKTENGQDPVSRSNLGHHHKNIHTNTGTTGNTTHNIVILQGAQEI